MSGAANDGRIRALRRSLRANGDRWLLLLAAIALATTFVQPRWALMRPAHEMVVVVDITQSMNVTDYRLDTRPASRRAFVRAALRQAVSGLPCGSRVGWAIFTEYRSFLLFAPVEVCAHQHDLLATLERIDGTMAWSGNSEVAKGLDGALRFARDLPGRPAVVFISDGHEAPPVNPRHRPGFETRRGEVRGLIVGTGGLVPAPIPKRDPEGRPLGFWKAGEVMQTDIYSQGRGGSVSEERMVETEVADPEAEKSIGTATGTEHLSSLREGYLKLLATETGLAYRRLETPESLLEMMTDPQLAGQRLGSFDLRLPLAALALLAVLVASLPGRGGRR